MPKMTAPGGADANIINHLSPAPVSNCLKQQDDSLTIKTGRLLLPMLLELQLTLSVAAKTHNKAPFGCR